MKIVMTGGGSGGHITPILAVASELKRLDPKIEISYIGLKGDVLTDVASTNSSIDHAYFVRAGKFRRYHSSGLKQLLDLKTQFLNFRDLIYVFIGLIQSYKLMRKIRPQLVFSRGGFVIVPVCLSAKLNRIPYITHDSDSIPSLANKIIAPWALRHFVALPKETYSYDQSKTLTTGIPLAKTFEPVTQTLKNTYRKKLDIAENALMVLVTGGGLGAASLNEAIVQTAPHLLDQFKNLEIMHLTGRNNFEEVKKQYEELQLSRVRVMDFSKEVYLYSGAADLVIARAGATNLAEFAVQGKACVIVPSSYLVAGHQLKNAKVLQEAGAVEVITDIQLEEDPNRLAKKVSYLLSNPKEIKAMEKGMAKFAVPDATELTAKELLKILGQDI